MFGNAVYHFDVPQPHQELTIKVRASVETDPTLPSADPLDHGEWDRLKSEFVRGDCFDFLHPHRFVEQTDRLRAFGRTSANLRSPDRNTPTRTVST